MVKNTKCGDIFRLNPNVDLHIHTTASDGVFSPVEVVIQAKKKGLGAIAITDHDTTLGLSEIKDNELNYDKGNIIEVVPGIELSTSYQGEEFHILGYYIDPKNPFLIKELDKFSDIREERVKNILERLKYVGIDLDYYEVKNSAEEGSIGRPHIARILVKKGYVSSETEAFEKYLNPTKPGFVKKEKVTPKRAIDLIKESGGLAFWAHPLVSSKNSHELLDDFINWGIEGIEVFHPEQDDVYIKKYWKEKALENGLLVSGGTDFHGYDKSSVDIGDVSIPYSCFKKIKEKGEKDKKL